MSFSSWLGTLRARFQLPTRQRTRLTRRKLRRRVALHVEALEDRVVLSTFTVTTTADNGDNTNPIAGSLRWAINQVNADQTGSSANPDTIVFNITADSNAAGYPAGHAMGYNATTGVATIQPPSALPTIYNPVDINGFSQPGSTMNTLPVKGSNAGDNAIQNIILDGSSISSQVDGLTITGGNSTVQGLVIQNFDNDIHLTTNGDDVIAGDYIMGGGDNGVFIDNVPNNTIGGATDGARNVFASNRFFGVHLQGTGASGNLIQGDYIGTDGSQVLGVQIPFGQIQVFITDGSNNVVADNLIAGPNRGIEIGGLNTPDSGNLVQGNYIGLNAAGTAALPGLGSFGVVFFGSNINNTIGGTTASARNVISGWSFQQVSLSFNGPNPENVGNIVEGNYIGTDAAGGKGVSDPTSSVDWGVVGQDNSVISDNLISGLGLAILTNGDGERIQGNKIGTDATGTQPIPNDVGIDVLTGELGFDAPSGELIGGTNAGAANIISYNYGPGVDVVSGTGAQIKGNLIYANAGPGVWVESDPFGSADPFGGFSDGLTTGISIHGNSIYGNGGLGIALGSIAVDVNGNPLTLQQVEDNLQTNPDLWDHDEPNNTVLLNDTNDTLGHQGANDLQNFPVLTSASSSSTSTFVVGTFSEAAEPNTTLTLDFYANSTPDTNTDPNGVSGYGQGQIWLGSTTVTTDVNGNVAFTADLDTSKWGNLTGQWITATATVADPNSSYNGDTSKFALDVQATATSSQTFSQWLLAVLPENTSQPTAIAVQTGPDLMEDMVISAVNALGAPSVATTITLDLNGGTYDDTIVNPPQNATLIIDGSNGTNTFVGHSPAFTVTGGNVIVRNVTFTTATDAPTVLVTGGSLTLRNDVVQESTGGTDAAISITGGILDLGTASGSGGNTLNVNGSGEFVHNTTGNLISAVGDTFSANGTPQTASTLSFTSLTAIAATVLLNQPVTFTVSVRPDGTGTPSGSVDFVDTTSNTDLGSVALSCGTARLTTTALSAGHHRIQARYSGDGTFLSSLDTIAVGVHYNFSGFLPPLSNSLTFAVNRTIPIKFTLTDYNGNAITSLSAVTSLQIQALDTNGNPIGAPFNPSGAGGTGLSYSNGQYLFNWQAKGLAAGSYEIVLKLADGTTQTKSLQLTAGGGSAGLVTDGSSGTATAGALLGGEVDLYVDNGNGGLTSDELARIQDAVSSIDATIAPYGVTIVEVSDPTQANVTLNMHTTSGLGGLGQRVLGCTTDADQVTMIQGWSWYAGADPTQVGAGQYDFETAVMHELGHVLGLGHSSSSNSVMYASLVTGTANRVLTTADLNVPDDDSGPCALHAAPMASVIGTRNSPSITTPSSSIPSSGSANSGSPMSAADQLFANFTIVLNEMRNGNQPAWSSVAALWQSIGALALQRLDLLLSMEAGAMGMSKDTLMGDLFLASLPTSNGL